MTMTTTPTIDQALFACQADLTALERDSVNPGDGYAFVSADKAIEICRAVLHSHGLTVRRLRVRSLKNGMTRSFFAVTHPESGEQRVDEFDFEVFKGDRDSDKAWLATLTSAWGYWLRDLLMLPRRDGIEIDTRRRASSDMQVSTGQRFPAHQNNPPAREEQLFDLLNPEHMRKAHGYLDEANVRSERRRKLLIEQLLVGQPLHKIGEIVRTRAWASYQNGRKAH